MKSRRGYTLIEILLAAGVLAVLMGLATLVVNGLMKVNRTARATLENQASLARLAETFRADVHGAEQLSPVAAEGDRPRRWEFTAPGKPAVVYQLVDDCLRRTTQRENKTTRRDFVMPAGATVTIDAEPTGELSLVALTVVPRETATGAPARAAEGLRVEARLGRDGRLAVVRTRPPAEQSSADTPSGENEKEASNDQT